MLNSLLNIFGSIIMVAFALGNVFLFFFLYGEVKRIVEKRRLKCLNEHNWSSWNISSLAKEPGCMYRVCLNCGEKEIRHNHNLTQLNLASAECEDRKMFCIDCGYSRTFSGTIAHDFEENLGFGENVCMRCNKKVPLL